VTLRQGTFRLPAIGDLLGGVLVPVPAWLAWCSPLIGAHAISVAVRLFIHESRHYQSSGW
jgi:hypothetical protein